MLQKMLWTWIKMWGHNRSDFLFLKGKWSNDGSENSWVRLRNNATCPRWWVDAHTELWAWGMLQRVGTNGRFTVCEAHVGKINLSFACSGGLHQQSTRRHDIVACVYRPHPSVGSYQIHYFSDWSGPQKDATVRLMCEPTTAETWTHHTLLHHKDLQAQTVVKYLIGSKMSGAEIASCSLKQRYDPLEWMLKGNTQIK